MPEREDAVADRDDLHMAAVTHIQAIAKVIDCLKTLGPCPLNHDNALANISERCEALADRSRRDWQVRQR
ncbi:hypothetical protein ACFOD4_08605 [Pseudoroseomonas globiformis]|uniref:Uncharacterized protein n=1 Tax=Teichococcus globiformis TaxID=2307229 RepID=A0ABV7FXK0_9PROT